jgi:hypothetical protein
VVRERSANSARSAVAARPSGEAQSASMVSRSAPLRLVSISQYPSTHTAGNNWTNQQAHKRRVRDGAGSEPYPSGVSRRALRIFRSLCRGMMSISIHRFPSLGCALRNILCA